MVSDCNCPSSVLHMRPWLSEGLKLDVSRTRFEGPSPTSIRRTRCVPSITQ
jgi:hypothetical protein